MPSNIYRQNLDRNPANYAALTPLSFLARTAAVYPGKTAVIHGEQHYSYAELDGRCRRLASALARRGIGEGDTVAIMAPNVPAMLEAHFGVPMAGAVLNCLNTRLDAHHRLLPGAWRSQDADHRPRICRCRRAGAEARSTGRSPCIDIDDPFAAAGRRLGDMDYEAFIAEGDPASDPARLAGRMGGDQPRLYLRHHRQSQGRRLPPPRRLSERAGQRDDARCSTATPVYLWTLPMFHCNGWSFPWAVTALAGTHVCLRRVDPAAIYAAIKREGVTHLCGAPIVLNMLVNAPEVGEADIRPDGQDRNRRGGTAQHRDRGHGAQRLRVTHVYGLTECYGPGAVCAWHDEWDALAPGRASTA